MTLIKPYRRSLKSSTRLLTSLLALGLALALAQPLDAHAGTLAPKFTVYGAQVSEQIQTETVIARQVGRPDNIDELIRRLPLSEIHRRLCGQSCTIRAAYVPGDGLYLDDAMRPLTNRYDQSILFHELVHHVQDSTSSHAGHDECRRWRKREVEAYALQNQFLHSLGLHSRVLNPGKFCSPSQA